MARQKRSTKKKTTKSKSAKTKKTTNKIKKQAKSKKGTTKRSGRKKKRFLKKDLQKYRKKLIDLKEDIFEQVQDISSETLMKSQKDISGDVSGCGLHMADVATDNYERDFNLNLISTEQRIIIEIDQALKRIEENNFGTCLGCKKPITKKRLNAIPYSRYCTKCQDEIERQENI
jgi:RNA polymerase-binding transcription factor DksA